uniref:Protein kinase domain-containing protein n=1 Tax=Lotharella globosa TaxID=91324 RepID=A0A7S3YTQ3_9EUKA
MGNANTAQFPYDIGDELPSYKGNIFRMREGKRKDSGEAVTIFTLEKKDCSSSHLMAAQNFHLRLKTIRHPHILRYIDGIELDTAIHVVTENVRPFEFPRRQSDTDIEAISLGLFQVTSAIAFLNTDQKLVHANICPASLFVTDAGEWKLGGFHLLHPYGSVPANVRQNYSILPSVYRSPEVKDNRWSKIESMPVWTMDAWSLGCVEERTKQITKEKRKEKLENFTFLPF